MRVFISWSGDRSRAVADLLDEWLRCVLQAIDPWMSSKDIDRGALWFSEIADQLRDTNLGIICITQENKDKPWILFEAGALAKGLNSARVCTLLIDLQPTDVSNPLAQFNHTMPDRESMFELIRTVNAALGDKALRDKVLERVFSTYWPQFEEGFRSAVADHPASVVMPPRSEENILLEVLRAVRSMDRRIRHLEVRTSDTSAAPRQSSLEGFRAVYDRVRRFIDNGMPAELVEKTMSNEVPPSLLREFIERAVSERGGRGQDAGDDG